MVIHKISDSDFDKDGKFIPGNDKTAIVLLHTTGCPHCRSFKPEFDKAAEQINSVLGDVLLDDANAVPLRKRLDKIIPKQSVDGQEVSLIGGVPAVLGYSNGMLVKAYRGPRTVDGLRAFDEFLQGYL